MEPEESVAFASLVYFYNRRYDARYNGRILCARVAPVLGQNVILSIVFLYNLNLLFSFNLRVQVSQPDGRKKVKLSLYLTKHYAMKEYGRVDE
jgi:hypothetical protein